MAAIKWRSDLETGIAKIDNQHKEIFRRINDFLAACEQGKGKDELEKTLAFLTDYVQIHFKDEEDLQIQSKYPDYEAHRKQHQDFRKNIIEVQNKLKAEGASLATVLLVNRIVVNWLVAHIGRVDKAFAEYLKKQA